MLKIFNSYSNKKEPFVPYNNKQVTLYVCGPTVYNEIHIGNARSLIVFDLLFRILNKEYDNNVVYARNITDIDDKIIKKAYEENKTSNEVARFWIHSFRNNCLKLNVLQPTVEPLATDNVNEIIQFIEQLIEKDMAYINDGHVFFKINKLKQYGELSKQQQVLEACRIEANASKDDINDFVLWKPSKENEPYWLSPWGQGRPGWHIECSAMSMRYLGEKFDIHGGGSDLMFPHHENERAQNIGLNGCDAGPKYWMHNAMLTMNDQKMSKSLNNIILLTDLFKKYNPIFIRFFILSVHYRHLFSWTENNLQQSANRFDRWINHLKNFETTPECLPEIYKHLLNDMNTPGAFAKFDELLEIALNSNDQKLLLQLANTLHFLGCMPVIDQKIKINKEIQQKLDLREEYRLTKKYDLADQMRKEIEDSGYSIVDSKNGYSINKIFNSKIK